MFQMIAKLFGKKEEQAPVFSVEDMQAAYEQGGHDVIEQLVADSGYQGTAIGFTAIIGE